MIDLIYTELYILWKKKTIIGIFLIIFSVFFCSFLYNSYEHELYGKNQYKLLENELQIVSKDRSSITLIIASLNATKDGLTIQYEKEKTNSTLTEIKMISDAIDDYSTYEKNLIGISRAVTELVRHYGDLQKLDWKGKAMAENQLLIFADDTKNSDRQILGLTAAQSKEKLSYNEYCLRNNIKQYNSPFEPSFSNLADIILTPINIIVLLIITSFVVMLACLEDFKSGVFKIIYTQNHSIQSIFFSKILSSSILIILSTLFSLCIISMGSLLIYGVGNLNLPYYVSANISTLGKNVETLVFIQTGVSILLKLAFLLLLIISTIISFGIVAIVCLDVKLYFTISVLIWTIIILTQQADLMHHIKLIPLFNFDLKQILTNLSGWSYYTRVISGFVYIGGATIITKLIVARRDLY